MASIKDLAGKQASSTLTEQSLVQPENASGTLLNDAASSAVKTIAPAAIGATMTKAGFNILNKNLLEIE
ncbi:MAG: hypothetical protein Q4B26_00355 [Eubacteriales bacterium]|nr:hypothetical protein [Eubacteriales bacterium]